MLIFELTSENEELQSKLNSSENENRMLKEVLAAQSVKMSSLEATSRRFKEETMRLTCQIGQHETCISFVQSEISEREKIISEQVIYFKYIYLDIFKYS